MTSNAVVTPHRLSAEAGRAVLQAGGNAVDAAVAAVAAQGVVAPETCGLGGDLFALIHQPGWDRPRALNSSGRAGSNVDAGALRNAGAEEIPWDHPAAVTVPGCVDGMLTLVSELGTSDMLTILGPVIALAEDGFEVSTEQASAFGRQAAVYRDNPAVSAFYPEGRPVERGDRVVRSDLARTLNAVASGDRDTRTDRDQRREGVPTWDASRSQSSAVSGAAPPTACGASTEAATTMSTPTATAGPRDTSPDIACSCCCDAA